MKIAVIGAGASGLAAAKALREVGLDPAVYEAAEEIGGLWVYHEQGAGPAYRSLRTNTSKQITAFSDFPFPTCLPDFPSGVEVAAYLHGYAARFDLLSSIRFGCRVQEVLLVDGERWQVTVTDGRTAATEVFDAVLVCSGMFRQPIVPDVPGLEGFPGQWLHSVDYRVPERFAGQNVLVVGLGSSAVDIAADLVGVARSVTLSARRGAWIAPREVGGRPLDHRGTRLSLLLPASWCGRRRHSMLLQEYARRGLDSAAVIWQRAHVSFDPETAPSVTSDDLVPHIVSGAIAVRPGIERVDGAEVVFDDGSRLWPDTIIFCTGYGLDFPFLPPDLQPWSEPEAGLYRLVFPPDHPTLAFIGVCRVQGPILPIVEMQARWVAQLLAGNAHLPSPGAMRAEIAQRVRRQTARRDSLIRVALLPYMDEIGALIGVRPRLWRHPRMAWPVLAGPPVAAQYRLDGPGRWTGAEEVIRAESSSRRIGVPPS